jgi:cellulose synthase/poly-beta-1,6-N-acetylglucosamine synthase-like glycosyltransferase
MKNEEQYIGRCVESVVNQDYPRDLIEVIVVDGGSNDDSLGIVKKLAQEYRNIVLLGGPGVNCPAAMNIGIKNAKGDIVAKVDAHGYVASDFLRMSVRHLLDDKKAKCVGGQIRSLPESSVAKANVFARSSVFGVGKGIYSLGDTPQYVETVQCGVYEKAVFDKIGLFDESLQFGEDEEVNWRIVKNGYKIYYTPDVRFFYFPRNSFRKLYEQYFNYGVLRVMVILKHPDFLNIKHVIPAIFVLALFATAILSVFSSLFLTVFLGIVLMYVIVSLMVSAAISSNEGWKYFGLLLISFAALHFGYGMGFLKAAVRIGLLGRILDRRRRRTQG